MPPPAGSCAAALPFNDTTHTRDPQRVSPGLLPQMSTSLHRGDQSQYRTP